MKRDVRLHGLSSEHHLALVLARRLSRTCDAGKAGPNDGAEAQAAYDRDLEPHFALEEELILPPLARSGEGAIVRRVLEEHEMMRALLVGARRGENDALLAFSHLLTEHVRFEERVVLPLAERVVPASVLDEVQRRLHRFG